MISNQFDLICRKFSFMPKELDQSLGVDYDNYFKKLNLNKGLTFYGGSFNPFHRGHLECLLKCPEENLILIPDINPHKDLKIEDESKILEDLSLQLKDTPYLIYPRYYLEGLKNPTSSWISKVRHHEVNLLIGDDSFMNLLRWTNPQILINSIKKLYVVSRLYKKEDYKNVENDLLKINKNLDIIYLGEHDYMNLSSSEIRKNLK